MISRRMRRRLVWHHGVIAVATACALMLGYGLTTSKNPVFRWSMSSAYVGLALLGATFAIGPLNVLRRRPNPISTDLRRDLGIWAGLLAIAHFLVGWQVHMKHRYLYWLREAKDSGTLVARTDLFGFGNYTGLAAVIVALLLLALSNDYFLRTLGAPRWKRLQRWNYALFALVVAHGVAYQVIEKRNAPFVILFSLLTACSIVIQLLGYRRVRSVARSALSFHNE
jgi:methionine sulfoxide reductase heme-binding subunit